MNYKIEFDEALKIVHVAYEGTVSLNERIQAVKDVCSSFAGIGPLKILVNVCGLIMHLSIEEQITYGEYLAVHPGLRNARVAVLHPSSNNPNVIIDSTAFSNGYKLAQFTNIKDATDWLRT